MRGLGVLAASLLVAACSVAPVRPVTEQQAQARRPWHETIDIGGRLSVRYQQQGEQLLTGSFNWVQRPDSTQVTLLSPFGQAVARIEITPGRASLQRSGQPVQVASDVDQLTTQALGWPLPVSGLRGWLQGFGSAGGNDPVRASPNGETAFTSADGWRIVYASWEPDERGASLRPRRIDLFRRTQEAGDVAIRIVIDTWQPAASARDQ
ncbi:MAG: lolB [Paucimonas sp.]|nr:lolB [Paucimonas sp.]